ncbi:MAG: CidA/LrgA family protein [Paracoccaceae bacterium]
MLHALIAILTLQLLGEAAARALSLPLPGPVLGMILMLAALVASPRFAALIRPTAQGILSHLSLLFVPAGVGVVGHFATLGNQAAAILLAVVVSTILAITVGALTFAAVARLTGSRDDRITR